MSGDSIPYHGRVHEVSPDQVVLDEDGDPQPPPGHSWVYFIRCPANGLIKVGFTDHPDPWIRIELVAGASPVPVEVLGVVPGGRYLEKNLHAAFAPYWHHNEWFEPAPALVDFIKVHAREVGAPSPRKFGDPTERKRAKLMEIYREHYCEEGVEGAGECSRCRRVLRPGMTGPCLACHAILECEHCEWGKYEPVPAEWWPGRHRCGRCNHETTR